MEKPKERTSSAAFTPYRIGVVAVAVVLSALASVSYLLRLAQVAPGSTGRLFLLNIAMFGITSCFAVWTAHSLSMPSLLLLSSLSPGVRVRRFVFYGLAMGLVISYVNGAIYSASSGGALQPWYFDRLRDQLDVLALCARSAFAEETLYRLFAIPFFVSVLMRVKYGWRPGRRIGDVGITLVTGEAPDRWMVVLALASSSVFFALAHPFNSLPALLFGTVLGFIFLRGGWESAVAAHFLANYVVLSALAENNFI